MADEHSIGLAELIDQVKRELLKTETDSSGPVPLFSVDAVTLELQVTVEKAGNAGVRIWVVELGGKVSRDDAQKVTVTLSPLLSKEDRVALYKDRHPENWKAVEEASVATLKGGADEQLDSVYGS